MYLTSFTRKDFCCLEFLRFHSVIFLDFLEKEEEEREIGISSNPKTKERSKITHLNGNNRQLKHREVAAGALVGHFTARGIYGNRAEACVCVYTNVKGAATRAIFPFFSCVHVSVPPRVEAMANRAHSRILSSSYARKNTIKQSYENVHTQSSSHVVHMRNPVPSVISFVVFISFRQQ